MIRSTLHAMRTRGGFCPGLALAALVLVGLVALALPSPASAQSAFTRRQLTTYAKLGFSYFRSNRFYDLNGELNDNGQDLELIGVPFYAEFGILDELTLTVNWQAARVLSFANTTSVVGTGDLRVGLKGGLSFGRHHIAAIVAPEFPTGDPDATVQTSTTLASGQVVTSSTGLPTGDGEVNVWTRLAYSVSLWEDSTWINAHFGANWRTQGYNHQLAFGLELGHKIMDAVYFQARLNGQFVPAPQEDLRTDVGFIYGEGTEFVSIGAGIAVPIPHTPIGLTVDWEQIIAYERNVYAGPLVVFGVSFECGPRSSPDAELCH